MKPILFALLSSLVFLGFVTLLFRPENPANLCRQSSSPSPTPIASPQVQVKPEPPDPNQKFRIVSPNFAHVDFQNRSYGQYSTSSGDRINLNLINGDYKYSDGDGREWFELSDIYFTDVTGDETPEAIVNLLHVQCGASCDGGSDLFIVYRTHDSSLKEIWRFETGSYAYGCGLKSLTIMKKQLTVQMFGKCLQPELEYSGPGKFLIAHTTLSNFRLSRGRFVKTDTEFFFAAVRDLRNYHPQIHIIE